MSYLRVDVSAIATKRLCQLQSPRGNYPPLEIKGKNYNIQGDIGKDIATLHVVSCIDKDTNRIANVRAAVIRFSELKEGSEMVEHHCEYKIEKVEDPWVFHFHAKGSDYEVSELFTGDYKEMPMGKHSGDAYHNMTLSITHEASPVIPDDFM